MFYKTVFSFLIILPILFTGCSTSQPKNQDYIRNEPPTLEDNLQFSKEETKRLERERSFPKTQK